MIRQRSSDAFVTLVAAGLLLLMAWGDAVALLVASVLGLLVGWVFFRPRDVRAAVLAALMGAVIAVVIVAIVSWLP
jgi:hypothetical protein